MWKRFTAVVLAMALCFSFLYMRVGVLASTPELYETGLRQSLYTVTAGTAAASVYDRNLIKLNNKTGSFFAVIPADNDLYNLVLPYIRDADSAKLKSLEGKPFSCEVSKDISFLGIPCYFIPDREKDMEAIHILGYNLKGAGATGLELGYEDYFKEHALNYKVSYSCDAKGKLLNGALPVRDSGAPVKAGIVTAIDSRIQSICQRAAFKMKKGAVIVMKPETGEIVASVSVPSYSLDKIGIAMSSSDSPMVNRAFSAYSIGSAFKIVLAAAAFKEGKEDFTWNCTGEITVGEQRFRCHNHSGHGSMTMETALAESCNTYFIALGRELSAENLLDTASSFGFGRSSYLARGILPSSGRLQTLEELSDSTEKGNFSFGQGKLTATPLQVSLMTSAIVNGGKLPKAKLILGATEDGNNTEDLAGEENACVSYVLDGEFADKIKEMLVGASKSSGQAKCRPLTVSSGGKTSTAQTGQFENGREIMQTWFTGFFPANNPQYVVTVLCEDGKSGNSSAGPVFSEIADGIAELYGLCDAKEAEIPVIFPKND